LAQSSAVKNLLNMGPDRLYRNVGEKWPLLAAL